MFKPDLSEQDDGTDGLCPYCPETDQPREPLSPRALLGYKVERNNITDGLLDGKYQSVLIRIGKFISTCRRQDHVSIAGDTAYYFYELAYKQTPWAVLDLFDWLKNDISA